MKTTITLLLTLYLFFGCKQSKTNVVLDSSPSKPNESIIKKSPTKVNNPNCFSTDDIEKIKNHYRDLEKAIKSGSEYDFTNSPVEYSDKDISWLKKTLKKTICKGEIKKRDNDNNSCTKSIIYNIDCSETIIIDGDEHYSEQDYWDVLVKKDGKIIISESGGAG